MNELALAIPWLGKRNPAAARWVVAALAVGAPLIAMLFGKSWVRILDFAMLYVMLAIGLNLVVGFAGGGIPALPWNLALLKGASIVGVFWGDFAKREPQNNAAMMQELSQWWAQGRIKPVIDRTMPMSELFAAYERMGSRQVQGKLVLVNA